MSDTYYVDLYAHGLVDGRNANQQDFSDALRSLADAATRATQHGDEQLNALCRLGMRALLERRARTTPPY